MKKTFALLLIIFAGCAFQQKLTLEQKIYVDKCLAFPAMFSVPKDSSNNDWARAQAFVGRYSSMKIQASTDYSIQTYTPVGNEASYGYNITRMPLGDSVSFQVTCVYCNMFTSNYANTNGHIAAYYIATGDLEHAEVINQ